MTMTAQQILPLVRQAVIAAEKVQLVAKASVRDAVAKAGGMDNAQNEAHGFAWLSTYVEALRQMQRWAEGLASSNKLGEVETLLLLAGFGEYCAQLQAAFR